MLFLPAAQRHGHKEGGIGAGDWGTFSSCWTSQGTSSLRSVTFRSFQNFQFRNFQKFSEISEIFKFFTSRFSAMVLGWVGVFFFFLLFWGRLMSCSISQHDKPQTSFQNGQIFKIFQIFRIFKIFRIFLVSEYFRFSDFFSVFSKLQDFQNYLVFQIALRERSLVLPNFPFPSMLLKPRNTLAAAGSL